MSGTSAPWRAGAPQAARRATVMVAVVAVTVGMLCAPYLIPGDGTGHRVFRGGAAFAMFAPWFAVLERLGRTPLTRTRAVLWAATFGFVVGGARLLLVLGWALPAAEDPVAAAVVVASWVGTVHAAAASIALVLLTSRRPLCRLLAAALVPAVDWVLSRTTLIPIPYLTAAFALSGAAGPGVLGGFGWAGLSTAGGAMGASVAALFRRGRCGTVAAVGLMSLATLGLVADSTGERDPDGKRLRILAFRSGAEMREWCRSPAPTGPPPDLIVLPEEEVVMPSAPGSEVRSEGSATTADLYRLRHRYPAANIISGVMIVSATDDSYRNAVLALGADGRETVQDKATPAPGGERVPFQEVPVVGDFLRRTFGVTGTMVTVATDRRPVRLGTLRVATAVCFEHTLLDSRTAWGCARGEADLLVAVAYLGRLGKAGERDIERTEPARRLHAARLTAPLVYVTNLGVGTVTCDGNSAFTRYGPDGSLTLTADVAPRTHSVWPSLVLLFVIAAAAIVKVAAY